MSKAREKWDGRYLQREVAGDNEFPQPPEFFTQQLTALNPCSALDLASGDGAMALWLAQQGFAVTAVDISAEGLKRMRRLATDAGLSLTTRELDLEEGDLDQAVGGLQPVDLVTISRYKPVPELLRLLHKLLLPGGHLLLATFNQLQHEETGFPLRFCLQKGELSDAVDGLVLESYSEGIHSPFIDGYHFIKS